MKGPALACLLAGTLAIAGCTAVPSALQRAESPEPPAPSSASPQPPAPAAPSPAPAVPCTDDVAAATFATVRTQQQAFAANDFSAGRRMASKDFRSRVTVREFKAIIEDGYAFLLADPQLEVSACRMDGTAAMLRIEVDARPAVAMAYRLVLEGNQWRIDGASILPQVSA